MNPWLFLVLLPAMALTTYRLTRLLVEDTFPPVLWLRDRLVGGWRPLTEKELAQARSAGLAYMPWKTTAIDDVENRWVERARWVPYWLADLLSCPFCASGWIGAGVVAGAWFAPAGLSVPVLCWFSVWAIGGVLAAQEWA